MKRDPERRGGMDRKGIVNTLLIDHGAIGDDREADMDLLERVRASRMGESHKRRIIGAIKREQGT